MRIALLCIDLINDYIDEKGKLSEGFAQYAKEHDVLQRIHRIQEHFREQGGLVLHSRTRFSEDYMEVNGHNPVYADVRKKSALVRKTWGTEFVEAATPQSGEPQITKHRNSPFYRTRLELVLRTQEIDELYIVGCDTTAAVALAAREAVDRDFSVTVIADACIDKSNDRHAKGIEWLSEVAKVKEFKDVALHLVG